MGRRTDETRHVSFCRSVGLWEVPSRPTRSGREDGGRAATVGASDSKAAGADSLPPDWWWIANHIAGSVFARDDGQAIGHRSSFARGMSSCGLEAEGVGSGRNDKERAWPIQVDR